MSRDDWFRNTTWNSAIEDAFETKLKRARNKSEYLRIQASYLAKSHPAITLKLLEQYFELGEHFDFASAFVSKAEALLTLNRIDEALKCYEQALAREKKFPNLLTNASLDFALLVAMRQIKDRYLQAIVVLDEAKVDLIVPRQFYDWNSAYALIQFDLGNLDEARKYAAAALEFADEFSSGFKYHPKVGVLKDEDRVSDQYCWVEKISGREAKPAHGM